MQEASTPLMQQYSRIKQQHPQALLFFRLGDFYELFFEDAVIAARELQITLTSRNKEKGVAVPMCGVPYHSGHRENIRQGMKPQLRRKSREQGVHRGSLCQRGGADGSARSGRQADPDVGRAVSCLTD